MVRFFFLSGIFGKHFNFVVHDYKLHEAHADMLICLIVHDIIDIMNILDWNSPKDF